MERETSPFFINNFIQKRSFIKMSNLSTEVFGDMNYLYEHIANQDAQELNENSDHYDEETTELVADILSTISSSMVYEGYSANAIISFLADSPEEDIIEKYLSFDENVITESVVSEDYIAEQLEIFDFAISENLLKLATKAASFLGRVASKPARMKAAQRLSTSNNPARTAAAYQKLANKNVAKVGFKPASTDGAPASFKFKNTDAAARAASMSKPIAKVKEIAKGAKETLSSPTAKKVGLGALALGAATGAGYLGGKMSGSGGDQPISAKPKPNPKSPASEKPPAAPKLPPPSNNSGGGGPSKSSASKKSATPPKPKKSDEGPAGETPMQKWARLNKDLASKVKPGQSGYDEISQTRVKPGPNEKQNQTPTTGPEASDAQKSQAGADVAALQAKQKAEFEKKQKEAASTQKESYDIIIEYLFDNGDAHTVAEAEYLMTRLDESFIQSLIENYHANLLAEEVTAWVNELVEEGYDLSEYSWDDMVDYYFTEARVDAGKTDAEKRTARSERGTIGYMHPFTRKDKKRKGAKPLSSTGKYSQMQHDKKQAQRERDSDEQRRRDRGAMGRGTWDKD